MEFEEGSLTDAWLRAFLATFEHGEVTPLVATLTGFEGMPPEDLDVRRRIDALLSSKSGVWSTGTTANTIFPASMWKPGVDRHEFYARYRKLFDKRLSKIRVNKRGTYFSRLISFGIEEINQLEAVFASHAGGVTRRSAFIASVFDPRTDHVKRQYLGFPCMHQVCFAPEGEAGFAVTGLYAKQDIFDRGYGNYLGLARLGAFMAHGFGRELTRVTCVASIAGLTNGRFTKTDLKPLADSLRNP